MIEITEDRRALDDGLQTSAHRLAAPRLARAREWMARNRGYAREINAKAWVKCQPMSNRLSEPAADVRTRLYVFNRLLRPA